MDWISVKDELPENYEDVLCYSNKNGGYFFIGYIAKYGNGEDVWCQDGFMHSGDVLCWCPLEAPKGA